MTSYSHINKFHSENEYIEAYLEQIDLLSDSTTTSPSSSQYYDLDNGINKFCSLKLVAN